MLELIPASAIIGPGWIALIVIFSRRLCEAPGYGIFIISGREKSKRNRKSSHPYSVFERLDKLNSTALN